MKTKVSFYFIFIFINPVLYGQTLILGSGFEISSSTVGLINDNSNSLEIFRSTKVVPDLSLIVGSKSNNPVTFRTGIILHKAGFSYKILKRDTWEGHTRWDIYTEKVNCMNLDIPILFSYITSGDSTIFRFETGPYYRHSFFYDPPMWKDVSFNKNSFGICVSAGLGSRKWQLMLSGFINISNNLTNSGISILQQGEKAGTYIIEINLSRVLHISSTGKSNKY